MAPGVVPLHGLVVKNARAFKNIWRHIAKLVQNQLPAEAQPTQALLQPLFVRTLPKHPLHRIAFLKQNRGRWYTTHSAITSAIRRATTSAVRSPGVRLEKSSFPQSLIGSFIGAQAGRAPFASTLRPNLTGGALGRTAGGYAWGSGWTRGARCFSHGPAGPSQVIANVSQAVRAFLLGGSKAHFDGIDPVTGEKRFKAVSSLQSQMNEALDIASNTHPGSYISFNLNPALTALITSKAVKNFPSRVQKGQSLNEEGLLEDLSVDFSRAANELAATLKDVQRLSEFGDLPVTYKHSILKVHFPGCDTKLVESICDDLDIQQGVVRQDENFDSFMGTETALLFPLAPSKTSSEYETFEEPMAGRRHVQPVINWQHMLSPSDVGSETYSTLSCHSFDMLQDVVVSPSSEHESFSTVGIEDMDAHAPPELQNFEAMCRFMSHCETQERQSS